MAWIVLLRSRRLNCSAHNCFHHTMPPPISSVANCTLGIRRYGHDRTAGHMPDRDMADYVLHEGRRRRAMQTVVRFFCQGLCRPRKANEIPFVVCGRDAQTSDPIASYEGASCINLKTGTDTFSVPAPYFCLIFSGQESRACTPAKILARYLCVRIARVCRTKQQL